MFILIILTEYFNNILAYMGIGDWGLGIGGWAQSPIPHPPSPIPNPPYINFFSLKDDKINNLMNIIIKRKKHLLIFFTHNYNLSYNRWYKN